MIHNNKRREESNREKLYKDGKWKECGRCHKIKLHNEFYSKKDGLRNICKVCNKYIVALESYENKLCILTNIYDGKFNGKWCNCDLPLIYLPAIDFHHQDKNLKQINWRNNRFKNWKKIMLNFEKESVIPLCRNCHSLENAKIFSNFREIILKEDLFEFSAEEIHRIIYNYVTKKVTKYSKNYKFRVIEWVKKRFVIEKLYDGKCIGCRNTDIFINLPALEFHHISGSDEANKLRWVQLKKYSIKEIIRILLNENCICLCSNCHTLLHSTQFKEIVSSILGKKHSNVYHSVYSDLQKNIDNFEFKSINIKDPLDLLFKQGDAWKKYILHIYSIKSNEKTSLVLPFELKISLNISNRHIKRVMNTLKNNGYIDIINNDCKVFLKLTNKANKSLKEILQNESYSDYISKILKKNK